MADTQLRITRTDSRSASLLQIHPEDCGNLAPLVAAFGNQPAGHSATEGPRAYSIGPAEWLLIDYPVQDVRRQLSGYLGRALVRLTDVSAAFASLKIEGAAARTVLASDIGAPWSVQRSEPGQYVRTRLGQVEVVLHCVGPDAFELHLDRSVADHLEGWLAARHAQQSPPEDATRHH
jgi:heterotetrameric sarcosine oxidase gamma subunit